MPFVLLYLSKSLADPDSAHTRFGFWGPVMLFNIPGGLMIFHGRRLMRNAMISLLEFVEIIALLTSTFVVSLINFIN